MYIREHLYYEQRMFSVLERAVVPVGSRRNLTNKNKKNTIKQTRRQM